MLAHAPVALRKSSRSVRRARRRRGPAASLPSRSCSMVSRVAAASISGMRAVGRDEVDDRGRVLEVQGEVGPAHIGLELGVAGHLVELRAGLVEGRHADVTAAGNVDRGEVERDAEQLVAQHVGDELVDLVAVLAGHATDDGAGAASWSTVTMPFASSREGQRVEEAVEQRCRRDRLAVDPLSMIDVLLQHRVAEAVHDVGELGDDAGLMSAEGSNTKASMSGCIMRANSSKTRCWYSISLVKRPAWNRRSPSQLRAALPCVGGRDRRRPATQQPLVQEGEIAARERHSLAARRCGCARSGTPGGRRSGRCSRCRGRRRR